MGVEREHLEGKVHAWETPQELLVPNSLSTLLFLLYSTLLSDLSPGPFVLKGKWEEGQQLKALLLEHLLQGQWGSGLSPRHHSDAAPQAEAAVLQTKVSFFAVVAQRKMYSQLLSAHETFVDVLLSRGIPNRVILSCAGQSPISFKPGAKLTAVFLWKEGRG